MATPKQTDPQFKLRIPADLKDRIERSARANNRTVSAEILNLLETHYPEPVTLNEIAKDIGMSIRWMHSFGGDATLRNLSDELYEMVRFVATSDAKDPKVRKAAEEILKDLDERRDGREWVRNYDIPDDAY